MIQLELIKHLNAINYNVIDEAKNIIKLNSFILRLTNEGIYIFYDIALYPDDAAKLTIIINNFCITHNIKCFIGKSYIEQNNKVFFGKDAVDKYLNKNYDEMYNFKSLEKFLEKSLPEDLHAC